MQYKSRLCFVVHIIQQSILIPPTCSMINIAGLILSSALAVQALPFNISMSQLACLHWLGNFKHTFTGHFGVPQKILIGCCSQRLTLKDFTTKSWIRDKLSPLMHQVSFCEL